MQIVSKASEGNYAVHGVIAQLNLILRVPRESPAEQLSEVGGLLTELLSNKELREQPGVREALGRVLAVSVGGGEYMASGVALVLDDNGRHKGSEWLSRRKAQVIATGLMPQFDIQIDHPTGVGETLSAPVCTLYSDANRGVAPQWPFLTLQDDDGRRYAIPLTSEGYFSIQDLPDRDNL